MHKDKRIIFISWSNYHGRTHKLGDAFGAEIHYIKNFINTRGLIWKLFFIFDYLLKSLKTLNVILSSRPDVVFIQNPPSIAPVVTVLYSRFIKFKVVLDSHNSAFEKPWKFIPFHKWALEKADAVLIHNDQLLYSIIDDPYYKSINFKVLNDKLIDYKVKKNDLQKTIYFLVISTFNFDEPMDILLESVKIFNAHNISNVNFKITGNYKKEPGLYSKYTKEENIEFLGFVPREEYDHFLMNAYGVISFTTRDNVQQCAVMEAISAEVPFISNNDPINTSLSGGKMILSEITKEGIVKSLELFIKERDQLVNSMPEIKAELSEKWENDFNNIKNELSI